MNIYNVNVMNVRIFVPPSLHVISIKLIWMKGMAYAMKCILMPAKSTVRAGLIISYRAKYIPGYLV